MQAPPTHLAEAAGGGGHNIVLPPFTSSEITILWIVLASAFIALFYGLYLVRKVLKESTGTPEMVEVAKGIQEGAAAYLARQFKTLVVFVVILFIGLYLMYRPVYPDNPIIPIGIAIAFLMGVFASFGAGYFGMWLAVRGNVRTAAAALTSYKRALETAFNAGTVSGMFTIGFGLLGATIIFMLFKQDAMRVLVGFGFGGCLAALFMRIGGGIYTKAADVGADLVGKVEAGIPEDDPRNAAVIADNVGDNVGDCAGMAADVFESYEVTLVAAIILGAGALSDPSFVSACGGETEAGKFAMKLIMYPLLVRAIGIFASIFGTWFVRTPEISEDEEIGNPMKPIQVGFWTSALASVVGFGLIVWFYMKPFAGGTDWRLAIFVSTLAGIILAGVIEMLTDHYTAVEKGPVSEIAYSSKTGPATIILTGMALGMESSVWSIVAIGGTILLSYIVFHGTLALAAYGIALSGLGLLTTTGFILAMDTYGPIADNANGIFEMSGSEVTKNERASRIVARLDAVGNTTKALTKGFAIATAVIAAIALYRSYGEEAKLLVEGIRLDAPRVFIGLLIGGAVPMLVAAFLIKAVSRSAFAIIQEVRRQFREIVGLMEGKAKPEYDKCVALVTAAAQKELLSPAIVAISAPILLAFSLGAGALGGFLGGAILSGQLLAVYMANTGGAWDNAKKKIEDGFLGGKGTEEHKAAVVGDTVGDPLKDTAGPALNPLIKVMNLVAILLAPIVIKPEIASNGILRAIVVGAAIIAIVIAVAWSSRGSLAEEAERQFAEVEAEAK